MDLIKSGMKYLGLAEIPGAKHNPTIVKITQRILQWVNDDETAWCSTIMDLIADEAGYIGSKKANARSWLNVGLEITKPDFTVDPVVVVFWRVNKNGALGHVGIPLGETKTHIFCMGGNQSNEYNVTKYPKSQLLGYRQLIAK